MNESLLEVLPMYMGVILARLQSLHLPQRAPHVYGGDPRLFPVPDGVIPCSPCIWG